MMYLLIRIAYYSNCLTGESMWITGETIGLIWGGYKRAAALSPSPNPNVASWSLHRQHSPVTKYA